MRNINSAFATLGLALCLGASTASWGWGGQPIQNVNDAPIVSETPVQVARVKTAIMFAGTSLGWKMAEVGPGLIQGTMKNLAASREVSTPNSKPADLQSALRRKRRGIEPGEIKWARLTIFADSSSLGYVRAYPASRWLRIASTNTVSIAATYR